MTFFFVFLCRITAILDAVWLWFRGRRASGRKPEAAVTAGAGVQSVGTSTPVRIGDVFWPDFPGTAHALWRAQELTLFRQHQPMIAPPILDLGCGDCLFGKLAGFPESGYGVDYDTQSLAAARVLGSKLTLLQGDAGNLSLVDKSISVCVSNSVLEHLPDLDACFSEVHRVLQPGGLFIFSMTLGSFTDQLRLLSGNRDAQFWVRTFGHLQQPLEPELKGKLKSHGFSIRSSITYQSIRTTALYRLMVSPVFQFFERRSGPAFRRRLRNWLTPMVLSSLQRTQPGKGACIFVTACRDAS